MSRILIVEDDPMISEIYQKKFKDAGYDVLSAESGDQAVNLLKKEKVDVMMLDLIMPKMDGFEVIKIVREKGYNPDMKILVFSNLSQKEDQDKAIRLGANGFIIKSDYTPSGLVEEVSRIMGDLDETEKNNLNLNGKSSLDVKLNDIKSKEGGKRILLIEDEQVFLDMFGNKLKQDGYIVETADNGAWGLKEALKKDFDLLIIDMVMPAMTGEEIIQKLKLEDKTKNIPIIALSASVENSVLEKVKAMGINEFFVKTQIIPSELSKKVEGLIGK